MVLCFPWSTGCGDRCLCLLLGFGWVVLLYGFACFAFCGL